MSVPRLGIAMKHNVSTLVNPTAAVGLPTRPTLRDGDGFRCALAAPCWLRASEHLVGEHVIGVLVALDGIDGLARDPDPIGQLLLRHLPVVGAQLPDGVGEPAVPLAHLRRRVGREQASCRY